MHGPTPCLWFDRNAEEAARFYAGLIPGSSVQHVQRSPADYPSGQAGDVLAVDFTLGGRKFKGLNGGPHFQFNEAVSFVIECGDQGELDRFWYALSAVPEAEQCGWCKDKYGLSWQVVPTRLYELLGDPDAERASRAMAEMLKQKRIIIAALEAAADDA
ncbi:MAG: VOC family protein [Sphingomicrobium sp.]